MKYNTIENCSSTINNSLKLGPNLKRVSAFDDHDDDDDDDDDDGCGTNKPDSEEVNCRNVHVHPRTYLMGPRLDSHLPNLPLSVFS